MITEACLRQKVWRNNTFNLVLGILLVPAAILLWFLSFWIFRLLFYIPLYWINKFFSLSWDVSTITWYIALFCMAVLVFDGLRCSRQLFDLHEFSQSSFGTSLFTRTASGRIVNAVILGNPVGRAYFISQILYMAPEITLQAVRALCSRLPADSRTISEAARILSVLYCDRQWVAKDSYCDQTEAILVLERLRLIWTRDKKGFEEIRIPPRSDPEQ